jgi:hypothetical protein
MLRYFFTTIWSAFRHLRQTTAISVGSVSGHFLYKSFSAAAKNHSARFRFGAFLENVVSLTTDLSLLELATGSEVPTADIRVGRPNGTANSLHNSSKVSSRNTPSAKDVPIGKPLSSQIPDGELAQHDLRARLFDFL